MTISLKADPGGTFGEILINGTPYARVSANGLRTPTDGPYFRRENILGTVSESGGVPTGAVIERGANANGEYVRFADGTQICWRNIATASYNITTAVGALFRSGAQAFSYPAAFSETPTGCAAVTGSDGRVWVGTCLAGASWSILLFSAVSGAGLAETLRLVAIGRWF